MAGPTKTHRTIWQCSVIAILSFALLSGTPMNASADIRRGQQALAHGNYQQALELLTPLASVGDARAQLLLGQMYFQGKGVAQDAKKATDLIKKSAEQNDPEALYVLSQVYGRGIGGPRDTQKARELLRRAALLGNTGARGALGALEFTEGNFKIAYRWLRHAADQGHADSAFLLAGMYMDGKGTEVSHKQAAYWYSWAGNEGSPQARVMLGQLLMTGQGTIRSVEEAMKCFRLAGFSGVSDGFWVLARAYLKGEELIKDQVASAKWVNVAYLISSTTKSKHSFFDENAQETYAEIKSKISEDNWRTGVVQSITWLNEFEEWVKIRRSKIRRYGPDARSSFHFPPAVCYDRYR